jgi:dTDP-4-amino-4,6-dideoxygalactose transaminase
VLENKKIPFNKPYLTGKEIDNLTEAVNNLQLAGNGPFTKKCQKWMEDNFDSKRTFLTTSCTSALEMAGLLLGLKPDDEVIMPSYTFVSTANAFALMGAKIQFIEIRPDTLNIDENQIEAALTSKTKLIVPVHYAGVGCDLDRINEIAKSKKIPVVEDAAMGINSTYRGKQLGTMGDMGVYSFHETKSYICGEGGAISINRPDLIEEAEQVWDKGTNRASFFRGDVDHYTWTRVGSSYLPSELTAAFLYAQLEKSLEITEIRRKLYSRYKESLKSLEEKEDFQLPFAPDYCQHNADLFYIILQTRSVRDRLLKYLAERNIQAQFHFIPLHTSPMGEKCSSKKNLILPVTDRVSDTILRLPLYNEMTFEDQDKVINAIFDYFATK